MPHPDIADEAWLVSLMNFDPGFLDEEENRVEPVGHNPFAPEVLPVWTARHAHRDHRPLPFVLKERG